MSENTIDREASKIRVGAGLGRIFSVFFRNIVLFGALGILCGLPSVLLGEMMGSFADAAAASTVQQLIAYIVPVFFWFLLAAAVVYGTVMDLRGGDARFMDCAIRGLSVVVPVIVVGILVYIILLLVCLWRSSLPLSTPPSWLSVFRSAFLSLRFWESFFVRPFPSPSSSNREFSPA
tara:strand:+ start:57 stop:587 length:531 start_codon:yes stop_codon:yes gene_type:complete